MELDIMDILISIYKELKYFCLINYSQSIYLDYHPFLTEILPKSVVYIALRFYYYDLLCSSDILYVGFA